MQTVALASALLLTIAIALPMSIGRDEAEMVLFQFSRHGPYGCAGDERNLVLEYAEWSYNSIVALMLAIVAIGALVFGLVATAIVTQYSSCSKFQTTRTST